jgi:hypothetical protein
MLAPRNPLYAALLFAAACSSSSVAPPAVTLASAQVASGRLTGTFHVQGTGSAPIFLPFLLRMPYVTVVDPGNVELHYDVVALPDVDVYLFPVFDQRRVDAGTTRDVDFDVLLPLAASDHFHFADTPATVNATVNVKIVQGYTSGFVFDENDTTEYQRYLAMQRTAASNAMSVTGF